MVIQRAKSGDAPAAFTLVELVIVVVIIGILAAVAIPRLSTASATSAVNALTANVNLLQSAIDRYTVEHNGRSPAQNPDDSVDLDGDRFVERLTKPTLESGEIAPSSVGALGPYLIAVPPNPFSQSREMQIIGASGHCTSPGYGFDSVKNTVMAGIIQATGTAKAAPATTPTP